MKDAAGKELKAATRFVGGLGLSSSGEKKPFIRTKVDPKQGVGKAAAWAQDCQKLAEMEHATQFHKVDGNFRSAYSEIRRIGEVHNYFRGQIKNWRSGAGEYDWVSVGTIKTGVRVSTTMQIKFRLRNNIMRVLFKFTPLSGSIPHTINPNYIGTFACMYDASDTASDANPTDIYCRNISQRFPELALYATAALDSCGLVQH